MSGWSSPPPPDADPRSSRQLIRRSLRLYRSTPRPFLLVAAVPELIRGLLALPGLVVVGITLERVVGVVGAFWARVAANPEAYQYADSLVLQAELETQMQSQLQAGLLASADLPTWSAVAGGLGLAVGLFGSAALTAVALTTTAGRPISVTGAFRLVAARAGMVRPTVALGIAWAAASLVTVIVGGSTDLQAWAGAPESPRFALIEMLLGVLGLVVTIGILVMAVRWALFIPVVVVESLGVGPGLARGAQLTSGIRVRLGQAIAGVLILRALSVGIVATAVGFVLGLSVDSAAVGVGAYLIAGLLGDLLWAPVLPVMLALAYRDRTHVAAPTEM